MVTKPGRLVALPTIAALFGGLLGVAPAHAVEPDIDPPVISEFSASPNPVDLSDGDVTMTVRMRVADPSGLKYGPIAGLHSETTSQSRTGFFRLVDGTNEDGTWQAEIEIAAASARGEWTLLSGAVVDSLGNSTSRRLSITVGPGGLLQAATPQIAGTPVVDGLLTATAGQWGPGEVSLAYHWLRDGSEIEGETDATYRPSASDLGREVAVRVSGSKQMYDDASRTSDTVTVQAAQLDGPEYVGMDGRFQVGETLTAVAYGNTVIDGTHTTIPYPWGPDPGALTYRWLRDDQEIVGATSATYEPAIDDMHHEISVRVTASKPGYLDKSATATPYPVIGRQLTVPATVEISGEWSVGMTLTADPGVWGPVPVVLGYQWMRDFQPIPDATELNYTVTSADIGHTVAIRVTGSKAGYEDYIRGSGGYGIQGRLQSARVTLSGLPQVGQTLTVDPGAWGPAPVAFTYQWMRGGTAIPGATGSAYTAIADDLGKQIRVDVRASKEGYGTAETSSPTVTIVEPEQLVAGAPTVNGTYASGQTLSANPGVWTPGTAFTYQWLRNGAAISGAANSTYALTSGDVGTQISVSVVGMKVGYTPSSINKTSARSAKVMKATVPKVSGTLAVGSTLKLSKGSWTSSVKFAYQWLRDGQPIKKATRTSYKLANADAARSITVRLTGKRSGYEVIALSSTYSAKVMKAATPKISGTKKVGEVLTVRPGAWLPGTIFTYQWYASGKAIEGATGEKLTLSRAQKKKTIKVKVTGSQPGHATVAKTSTKTARVK